MKTTLFSGAAIVLAATLLGAAEHTVQIQNFAFNPNSVTIQEGDTVTWIQRDGVGHTTTSDTGFWSSSLLSLNQTFSFTFANAGTYPYHCIPHPGMRGTVLVEAANVAPTVTLNQPADGTVVTAPAAVELQATASAGSGSISRVEFFVGSSSLGSVSNAPYNLTVDSLAPGANLLVAVATDSSGASATSATAQVTVNLAPSIAITNPVDGESFVAPATVQLVPETADADGSVAQVEYFNGLNSIGTASTGDFSITLADLAAGHYEITARASDNDGGAQTSRAVRFSVLPPLGSSAAGPSGANVRLRWGGGLGPFALQHKVRLEDVIWQTATNVATNDVELPADNDAGFFRVVDRSQPNEVPLTVSLSGLSERPNPLTNNASGSGILAVIGDSLVFNIAYQNLSGQARAAHIHGPAPASGSAPPLIDLQPYAVGAFDSTGRVAGVVRLTPAIKRHILAGRTYVNFHTAGNSGGEIRGQVLPVVFHADLSGAAERPVPVLSGGRGAGLVFLTGNQLTYEVAYDQLSSPATASHIHGPATPAQSASVMVGLGTVSGTSGFISGTATLTPNQLAALADGETYINIHTQRKGGGEIRGQLLPRPAAIPMTALLNGESARPNPVTTTAQGSGNFIVEGDSLMFVVRYAGLTGDFQNSHIHGPAPAATAAGVMIGLVPSAVGTPGREGGFMARVPLTPAQKAIILDGKSYVNVHSTTFGSGEIRGQIAPVLRKCNLSGLAERPNPVRTRGRGHGLMTLVRNELSFNLAYSGLSGNPTMAHIHGLATPLMSATVMVNLGNNFLGGAGTAGNLFGSTPLTPAHFAALVDGLTYVNIHTPDHGPGEIRGQIVP